MPNVETLNFKTKEKAIFEVKTENGLIEITEKNCMSYVFVETDLKCVFWNKQAHINLMFSNLYLQLRYDISSKEDISTFMAHKDIFLKVLKKYTNP